tara:strand:- start:150 stop:509 length:360 start_codon:yes stop_codon:yes gene_type:complete
MGIKTERFGYGTCGEESAENRYVFDFDLCSVKKGWAQVDTAQDASYFGTWAHPKQFKTVSFAEGDTCIKTADTAEEFKTLIDEMVKFYIEDGSWKGIDPGLDEKNIQAWVDLGLASLLH